MAMNTLSLAVLEDMAERTVGQVDRIPRRRPERIPQGQGDRATSRDVDEKRHGADSGSIAERSGNSIRRGDGVSRSTGV